MKGDKIVYFYKKKDSWQVITLTSNVFRRYLTNGWFYNFKFHDGSVGGNYLHPGEPYWGLLSVHQATAGHLDLGSLSPFLRSDGVSQLDGGITPESLTPEESHNESSAVLELESSSELGSECIPQHNFQKVRVHSLHPSTSNPIPTNDEYIDKKKSDQGSIFGETANEYFINSSIEASLIPPTSEELIEEATVPDEEDINDALRHLSQVHYLEVDNNWNCYPLLGYQDQIIPGRKYRIPRLIFKEARSVSEPDVRTRFRSASRPPSRWRKGLNYFLSFVDRWNLGRCEVRKRENRS